MDHERATHPDQPSVTEQLRSVSHTPGPWIVGLPYCWHGHGFLPVARTHTFATGRIMKQIAAIGYGRKSKPNDIGVTAEDGANADLIAAAPDMAAELSQLELEFESFIDCDAFPGRKWLQENLASIKAVLAKALAKTAKSPR